MQLHTVGKLHQAVRGYTWYTTIAKAIADAASFMTSKLREWKLTALQLLCLPHETFIIKEFRTKHMRRQQQHNI